VHLAGIYTGASGATYEGDFKNNMYDGHGKYRWADGAVYIGSWLNNKMHGKGEYVSSDGVRWAGEFFSGLYCQGNVHVAVR
jgi:hypothetical protein